MSQIKPIFAVDDWGFSKEVNEAILVLAKKNLLESVSLLATGPDVEYRLSDLQKHPEVQLHFHFNLTEGPSLSGRSSLTDSKGYFHQRQIAFFCLLFGLFKPEDLLVEFSLQLNSLEKKDIKLVGFNGHHHIHLFPFCMNLVAPSLQAHNIPLLREMADSSHLSSFFGGRILQKKMSANPYFKIKKHLYLVENDLLSKESFLKKISRGHSVLAHPAIPSDKNEDPFHRRRIKEYEKIIEYMP
jgi:predicted glycoside hydrolase/deacetylase ChbG (UPF0249 family)